MSSIEPAIISTRTINPEYGQTKRTKLDDFANIIIREAYLESPELHVNDAQGCNFLDLKDAINETNNTACLSWSDRQGGVINIGDTGKRTETESSYDTADRSVVDNTSRKSPVMITSPMLWYCSDNWCGIRWVPPRRARCYVGFGKDNKAYILGYCVPSQRTTRPILNPGEIAIKGYGNNYIHFRQSNKLDIVTGASQNDQDYDDCWAQKSCSESNTCSISLNSDAGYISLMVNGTGLKITSEGIIMNGGGEANMTIGKGDISLSSSNTVTLNTAAINKNGAKDTTNGG